MNAAMDLRAGSKIIRAHKIALDLNNLQATHFSKAAGVARFAYNWALAEWKRQYEAHTENPDLPKPNQGALRRQLNAIKRTQYPWMLEVSKNAPQMAIMQLGEAFQNFFAKRAKYPQFRKKGVKDRFTLTNDQVRVLGRRVKIPNLGWVRMREEIRFSGKILSATVSRTADRWYVSFAMEVEAGATCAPAPSTTENQGVVGVDLGVNALATLSTGEPAVSGPKSLRQQLQTLQRFSRAVSRKQKGSRNRVKARMKLGRLHARIANIRQNAIHHLTTDLTQRFHTIGIEDLNVRGMMANRRLSRAISDMGFFEFRRQLEYKAFTRGGRVVVANRFYASSKICSACGAKKEDLSLSDRSWRCGSCGQTHHRDLNAALNLKQFAESSLAVSSTVSACGEEGAGLRRKTKTKPSSKKQEVSIEAILG